MPTLDSVTRGKKFKAFVYGHFKTGKTAGALTLPRVNVIDFDRGTDVAIAPWWQAKFGISPSAIQVSELVKDKTNSRGVPTEYAMYDTACKYFDAWMSPSRVDQFDTWVIDSLTSLSEAARNKGVILLGGTALAGKPLSFTHKSALETGIVIPKMQDYGAERSLLEQFIDMVLSTDKHVVVIAHAKEEWAGEGNDAKLVGYVPMLVGQSVQRVPLKFNEVYWIELEKSGPVTDAVVRVAPADDGKLVIKRGSRMGLPDRTKWDWPSVRDALKPTWTFSPDGTVPPTTAATAAKE